MKLKIVGASMIVLGLMSSQALAHKHKMHKKHHHTQAVAAEAYKGEGALPVQPVMMESCPRTDMYTMLMTRMSQNVGRAVPTVGCDNPLSVAGGINFDTMWGNRTMGYQGVNTRRPSLNDAYLNVTGNVNEWVTAFMSASYENVSEINPQLDGTAANFLGTNLRAGSYSSVYPNETLTIEQGYITVRNWNVMPIYFQLGKQFQPFGRYTIHPMTRTMDQVLSETNRVSAQIGFIVPMGIHGAVYAFQNESVHTSGGTAFNLGHTQENYGAELGYDMMSDQLGFDIGLGYMYNMTGVQDVAYGVNRYNKSSTTQDDGNYINRVAAGSLYADVNSGPFSVGVRYVSALQHFALGDLGNNGGNSSSVGFVASTRGAKPWAAGITAAYGFNAWTRNQNVYLGFQGSGDAINLFLPKSRWLAGYGVDVWKNTNLGVEYNYDQDYSTGTGGTGNGSSRLNLRVGVKFG